VGGDPPPGPRRRDALRIVHRRLRCCAPWVVCSGAWAAS
jgi:hypothetical protein